MSPPEADKPGDGGICSPERRGDGVRAGYQLDPPLAGYPMRYFLS